MTYNALKYIDLTKFMKVLMCFLVSCSNVGGHVSPFRLWYFVGIFSHFLVLCITKLCG